MKKIFTSIVLVMILFNLTLSSANAVTYQETISSVVLVEKIDSNGDMYRGSGTIISNDAIILTAAHVIMDYNTGKPADYIDVCLIENEYSIPSCEYSARVLAYDESLDLALIFPAYEIDESGNEIGNYLEIEDRQAKGLPYVDFSDSTPALGDELSILGFPAASGLPSITLTKGIVSGFEMLQEGLIWKIITDATINPGNSGGPAYNADERVVGVISEVSLGGVGGNYGYIIANQTILLWFLELVEQGTLNEAFVNGVFSNDYVAGFENENHDYDTVEIFTDVDFTSNNAEAINYLKSSGVISGYPDGSFKPLNPLNRAELLKILVEGKGYTPDSTVYKNCFPDVKAEWYAPYVCYAKEQGWVKGYDDGKFKPTNNVNKAEALKMLLETFDTELQIPKTNPFTDVSNNEWYAKYVYTAKNMGLLEETGQYYWPAADITRGQISENIYRLIISIYSEKYAYVNAMVETNCLTEGFTNDSETESLALMKSAFAMYGLESTEEAMTALLEKYKNDQEALELIGTGVMEQCPEFMPQ